MMTAYETVEAMAADITGDPSLAGDIRHQSELHAVLDVLAAFREFAASECQYPPADEMLARYGR